MHINELLIQKNYSRYRLSKESGVPQTTITDICSGKARLEKCTAETLYKIAKALDVTMESLLEPILDVSQDNLKRSSFAVFKSNVCHYVKDKGDIDFMIDVIESNQIRKLYDRKWYRESFYLLAMLDYLSRENDIPKCTEYDDIRAGKLEEPLFPTGILLKARALDEERYKEECMKKAIPEFLQFNIIESEVRDVV